MAGGRGVAAVAAEASRRMRVKTGRTVFAGVKKFRCF
jgi:hypothetical protein